jgi:8-oxo-dGTP pyrophosphatase MutT (NUDIX family)
MVERRAVQRHGRMICFDDDAERFHMRAAGIALREGHVLVQRALGDISWTLPGGRMEQGETSAETLLREMQEELLQTVTVGPLTFLLESFFGVGERHFQEVGFYHSIAVPTAFPFSTDGVCHRIRDGDADVEFAWLPADEASLTAAPFRPVALRPLLAGPQPGLVHIVDRETGP